MELYPGQIVIIAVGFLILLLLLLCMGKSLLDIKLLEHIEITVDQGGYHLQDISISQVISHVIPYKLECSYWWKIYSSKKILYKICSTV